MFRQKDIRSWWANRHASRPGGVRGPSTAWVPQGKPIRFTEFGCPAVDKGPNQPNVFYDPKSSESFLPYFSTGSKDDPVQRAYLEATLSYWRDHSPTSAVYGGPMLSTADMYAWAWDARPFPDFPARTAVWHDTPNYELGHWLTGRLSEVPLKWIIAELCGAAGVEDFDTAALQSPSTLVLGYATDALSSPRDILAGLMDAHGFDARESGGRLQFFARGNVRVTALRAEDLAVEGDADPGYSVTRAGDTDLPGALRLTYADPYRGYASGGTEARRAVGNKLAARVNLRPFEMTGCLGVGAQSGALAGVVAGAPVFTLRNGGNNGELYVVRRVGVGFVTTTAFATPQIVDFGLYVARNFSAADSGGTQVSFSGSNQKLRSSQVAPNNADARIAAAGALTAGTRTLDPVPLGQVGLFSNAAGALVSQPWTSNLWDQYAGDHQIVLAPNEGLVIAPMTAFGSGGVGRLYVNVEFAVAAAY